MSALRRARQRLEDNYRRGIVPKDPESSPPLKPVPTFSELVGMNKDEAEALVRTQRPELLVKQRRKGEGMLLIDCPSRVIIYHDGETVTSVYTDYHA